MTKTKRKTRNTVETIIVLGLIVLLVWYFGFSGLRMSWVSPGWEIYDQVGAIRESDRILSQESDFTSPKELMGVYWKVDVDDPRYGVPTLMVEVGEIEHVDFTGRATPAETPAATMSVTRGNNSFYLDYHVYMYTVTIRTIADREQAGSDPDVWLHESLWPHMGHMGLGGGPIDGTPNAVGKLFKGGAYVKFVISPWRGVSYRAAPNESFALDTCWAGVMNTYVVDKTQGPVENQWGDEPPCTDALWRIVGGIDEGNQVPMFQDDGSFGDPAPRVDWGATVTPDTRIESTVVHYLPVEMGAGTQITWSWSGDAVDLAVGDVAIMYKLRVDVLLTHEFTLKTAIEPPKPTWPKDYFGWAESFWTTALNGLNPFGFLGVYSPLAWFIVTLLIVGFIVFILLAIFAPWSIGRIFRGFSTARREWRESGRKGRPPRLTF